MASKARLLFLSVVLASPSTMACSARRGAHASTESPLVLERVVLYRNGIGYFERSGEIYGDVIVELPSARLEKKIQLEDMRQELDPTAPQRPKPGAESSTRG